MMNYGISPKDKTLCRYLPGAGELIHHNESTGKDNYLMLLRLAGGS